MNQISHFGNSDYWSTRPSPWMSVAEAAFLCGMSEETVRRYAKEGAFWAIQPERYIRIHRASFNAWLESRRYAG